MEHQLGERETLECQLPCQGRVFLHQRHCLMDMEDRRQENRLNIGTEEDRTSLMQHQLQPMKQRTRCFLRCSGNFLFRLTLGEACLLPLARLHRVQLFREPQAPQPSLRLLRLRLQETGLLPLFLCLLHLGLRRFRTRRLWSRRLLSLGLLDC